MAWKRSGAGGHSPARFRPGGAGVAGASTRRFSRARWRLREATRPRTPLQSNSPTCLVDGFRLQFRPGSGSASSAWPWSDCSMGSAVSSGSPDVTHTRLIHYEAHSGFWERERASEGRRCFERGTLNADRRANWKGATLFNGLSSWRGLQKPSSEYLKCHSEAGRNNDWGTSNDVIARPISSPSPWSSGCRQLAWKYWDRGRGSHLRGYVQSGPRSCHWHKAATQNAMSAAAGRSWYLIDVRNRSRDRFDNLDPPLGRKRTLQTSRLAFLFAGLI
jgi:hypothetical protein